VAETTVETLLCCGFRRTGKSDGTSVSMLQKDMSRNKLSFFFRLEYDMCYVLYKFVTHLLRLPRMMTLHSG
jgi:hypothetical protein